MKTITKLAAAALLSVATVAVTASSASAYVACNREGECWHVRDRYDYHQNTASSFIRTTGAGARNEHYRWHEHQGRGYWRNGIWITF